MAMTRVRDQQRERESNPKLKLSQDSPSRASQAKPSARRQKNPPDRVGLERARDVISEVVWGKDVRPRQCRRNL